MGKVTPKTPVGEGSVIVRVGADHVPAPNSPVCPVIPVVQLIWPQTEASPLPHGSMVIEWRRTETKKARNISEAKYIAVLFKDSGDEWVRYRVSEKDRNLFESLRQKWGMWNLRTRRQGEDDDQCFISFNDGTPFLGRFAANIDTYVLGTPQSTVMALTTMWLEAVGKENYEIDTDKYLKVIGKIPDILEEVGGGPLPWIPKELPHWGKPTNRDHEFIVSAYIRLIDVFEMKAADGRASENHRKEYQYMRSLLRKAKIFEIAQESYLELLIRIDDYCMSEVAQLDNDKVEEFGDEEWSLFHARLDKELQRLPFPGKMPFDVCWFGVAGSYRLSDIQKASRGIKEDVDAHLVGMLATSGGELHEVFVTRAEMTERGSIIVVTHRVDPKLAEPWMEQLRTKDAPVAKWQYPACQAPFIFHAIVDCINEHQTVVTAQRRLSSQVQNRLRKGLATPKNRRPIPPAFYTVHMKDKTIRQLVKLSGQGGQRAAHSHRFDVRGHWCARFYRGPMPINPAEELRLENLNYQIYKTKPLEPWVKELMRERGLPPRQHGEWIAVKRWWRDSFVKGPEDAQYIPSTRKATKGILAIDNGSHRGEKNSGEASLSLRSSAD